MMDDDVQETGKGRRKGLKVKGGVAKNKRPVSKLIEITKMNMKALAKKNGKGAKMKTTTGGYIYGDDQ